MPIIIKHKGNFKNTEKMFQKMSRLQLRHILDQYGAKGVAALSAATPVRSGETANSWDYKIEQSGQRYSISWTNSNINNGVNIALIIQLGHGTGTGGYVQGVDYINPALRPIFDQMAEEAWQEVTK